MLEDTKIVVNSFEKDYPAGKSSNLDEINEDIRLKLMKELFLEWFSKINLDKNGYLFDSKGNILAKVFFNYYFCRKAILHFGIFYTKNMLFKKCPKYQIAFRQ
jgi:hypothetical protein